nr:nucleotidyltransferase [uncultured Ruminococcus sp.]
MSYSEDTLKSWSAPISDTEDQRAQNTIHMIKTALSAHVELQKLDYEVFLQGSYANNTNVRQNSDVDVCVMLKSTFHTEYADGYTDKDYGFTSSSLTYQDYKRYVVEALTRKFGASVVTVSNKCINIGDNTYHVNADVVPAFQYRNYKAMNSRDPNRFVEGIWFYAEDGTAIYNYPKQHIQNGKEKNNQTNHQYKQLVRMMKHIRNDMVKAGKADGNSITSFLIECLVWNVPNSYITGYYSWNETIKQAIRYLYTKIDNDQHKEWGEVSELLYLFHPGRKWTADKVKSFLADMYTYLGYVRG